jgi:hypothetical protein
MTADSQRVAIAKLLGWMEIIDLIGIPPRCGKPPGSPRHFDRCIDNPLQDLNAAFQFVEFLNKEHSITFEFENDLDGEWRVETSEPFHVIVYGKSLARAICEAGLKSINLWEDDAGKGGAV